MTEFEKVKYVRQCCFSILPQLYCDRFTIEEQIAKIVLELNKLITNNNKLEDYIKEIIREVIESGEIEEIIKDMLANYILNVKFPPEGITPASGDGTKDDTLAIQGCIDFANANGGKAVYFPSGKYLTQSLTMKNNVSLFGFDMKTTHLVLKGGAINALITGTTYNNQFTGLTFDGNADIQVNNVNLIDITGGNLTFNNLSLTDGYNLLHINLENDVQIYDVSFDYAVESCLIVNGTGLMSSNNLVFKQISALKGKYCIDNKVNNAMFTNIYSTCVCATAISNVANNCVFSGKIINAINTHTETGENNYYDFYNRGGTLSSLINEEITNREEADSILNTKIETEITNREEADSILNTTIETEITNREEAIGLLNEKINTEITEREEADNILALNIEKLKTVYNIKNYGALGDGTHDDTSAIQLAINDAQLVNGTVYIPKGIYMVSATLKITTGVNIVGEANGIGASGFGQVNRDMASNIEAVAGFTMGDIFEVITTKKVVFYNILISYRGTWVTGVLRNDGAGISIKGSKPSVLYLTNNGSLISNCAFIGQYNCITKDQCVFNKIYDNFFHLWKADAVFIGASLTTEENLGGWIKNNFFYGDHLINTEQNSCIHIQAGYIWITDNYILGAKSGIIGDFNAFPVGSVMIKDNSIEQQTVGSIWILNDNETTVNMLSIIGNNMAHQNYPANFNFHIYIQAGSTRWIEKIIIKNNTTNSTLTTSSAHFSIQDGRNVEISGNILDNINRPNSRPIFIGDNVIPLCVIKDNQYVGFIAKPLYSANCIVTDEINNYTISNMPEYLSNSSKLLISDGKKTSETDSTLTGEGTGTLAFKINNVWKAMF